jgi:secretion/DNA translocation related TadE-like protein
MSDVRSQRGQATVLTVVFVTALLGMAALVLDLGSWFQAQRQTQSAADAAALAAAQALPASTGDASSLATSYVAKNGAGTVSVTFSSENVANDTVSVHVSRSAPGFFAKLFGISSVDVGAKATARASGLDEARYVAPIAVNYRHPMLNCDTFNGKPVPCFGEETQLDLVDLHDSGSRNAAGSFGLINLDRNETGNIGASTLSEWVIHGFDRYMAIGSYDAAPSANFNNSQFLDAFDIRHGADLLFPIYKTITGPGSNAQYDVVGWVGFKVTSLTANGSKGVVRGKFTKVIWEGIQSKDGAGLNYGAVAIQLVE